MSKIALDTNIIIYNHGIVGEVKQIIADKLFDTVPVISTQVISEYLNVMKRISKIEKSELLAICAEWLEDCHIHAVGLSTIKLSHQIIKKI
jgi:predicted nucleic acid-binding protein